MVKNCLNWTDLMTPFRSRSPVLRCFFSFRPWKKN